MTRNRIQNRIKSFISASVLYLFLLSFVQFSHPSLFFVLSESEQERTILVQSNRYEEADPVRMLQTSGKQGEWIIEEKIDKNNFDLRFIPEGEVIMVSDYDSEKDILANITYTGKIFLNAFASNEDFDVAPRYVESFTGIKYASVHRRFDRSKQAYAHTIVGFGLNEDGKTREIMVDATKYGKMCIQPGVEEKYMSEDCLFLNIWRPSRWKQLLNTTTMCKQKFLGNGLFRKDCEIISTTRTTNANGSVVIKKDRKRSSKTIELGGVYDKDGAVFNSETDVLDMDNNRAKDENDRRKGEKNRGRVLQLSNALDDLQDALKDLNEKIDEENDEENEESEEENDPNSDSNKKEDSPTLGTYNVDGSGLLPVMVYIHGGGFLQGSGNDILYDGSKAAGRGQVIIITLNYRLGIFGFMPSFGWDQWKVNGGMNGFMDIVEALTWIQRNIIHWGGNPDKVTVFGPSSTPAVCLLTMCPLAAGKFQRAILQSSVRDTELRNGRFVTQNGASGASCLLSSQEPYQPLEGRIEIAYKFFDFINWTYYNFTENPDPTREDIVDWLRAFRFNGTEMLQVAIDEGTVFAPQRPSATFDYNRDGNVTGTHQRRTFLTWDNDIFPRMPIDLEYLNPVEMIVGGRGRRTNDERPNKLPSEKRNGINKGNELEKQHADKKENSDNIFLRGPSDSVGHRELEELDSDSNSSETESNNEDDYFVDFNDDIWTVDEELVLPLCSDIPDYGNATAENEPIVIPAERGRNWGPKLDRNPSGRKLSGNKETAAKKTPPKKKNRSLPEKNYPETRKRQLKNNKKEIEDTEKGNGKGNETTDNETIILECRDDVFEFNGTTSDQDICLGKKFAEIAARNIKGKVYAYALDDLIDLYGYNHQRTRRELREARDRLHEEHADYPERLLSIRRTDFDYNYDIESMYFFDNIWFGMYGKDRLEVRKEIFNRWINFAKTGVPKVTSRSAVESRKHVQWIPFPRDQISRNTNEEHVPSYLYMTTDFSWDAVHRRSTMVPFESLLSHRTRQKYPYNSGTDLCTWVMEEENDFDNDFVEILLDYDANTAFEYYVTILATLNPTINYVPEQNYTADLPPTMAPSSIQQFIDGLERSSSSPSFTQIARRLVTIVLRTVTMTVLFI